MNFAEMFTMLEEQCPSDPNFNNDFSTYQPKVMDYQSLPPGAIAESYQGYAAPRQQLYNLEGYISPYSYDNWGASTKYLSNLSDDTIQPPGMENKLDPNKIFNSDIAALRTSAADQLKITRAFERKLLSSLGNKESQELSENDIAAMQAITASRNTMIAASNGQVAIKKNIADIKIKQQQNRNTPGVPGAGPSAGVFDAFGAGKGVLDDLINVDMRSFISNGDDQGFEAMSAEEAGQLIGSVSSISNDDIMYENEGAKTFVVPAPDGGYMYETYDNNGNILPEFKNPTTEIDKVDRESGYAQDSQLNQYPLKLD